MNDAGVDVPSHVAGGSKRPQRDKSMLDWVHKADRMLIDSYGKRTGIDFSNHKAENLTAIDQYFLGVLTREKARQSRKYYEINAIAIASYLGEVMVQNLGGSWHFPSALEALFVRLLGNRFRMQRYWYVLLGREKVYVLRAALEAIDRTAREFSLYDFYHGWEWRIRPVAMDANETAFIDRLSKAFPAVARLRSEHLRENGDLLAHPFLGDVARYAISLFESASDLARQELRMLFDLMEREYASGTPSVRALIALGFLENLAGPPEPCWPIRTVLGPGLRKVIEEMWPGTGAMD